jgi:UDP-N-acetylglucosamine 2-epimerase (non-hydrolysing)
MPENRASRRGERHVLCVVGARPNFMKIAPVLRAVSLSEVGLSATLLHTGQHYDAAMKEAFFTQLGVPEPDIDLEVGSATHAVQTAEIMRRFEPVLNARSPGAVLVVGDVNSTIACALVAAKKGIAVFHVEAGLRSYDRDMPEEINRVLTDQLSELLFTTERSAAKNLQREGIDESRIHFVGNVMIDSVKHNLQRVVPPERTIGATPVGTRALAVGNGYGVVTLHRPSNVDDRWTLKRLLGVLREISNRIPLVFPLHPRTSAQIDRYGLRQLLDAPGLICLPPQGYLEMLGLLAQSRIVLTDSGGIQEETTVLGVPCLTMRENTERPITIEQGTNTLVGADPVAIAEATDEVLRSGGKAGRVPELWDGGAAERIVRVIEAWFEQQEDARRRRRPEYALR